MDLKVSRKEKRVYKDGSAEVLLHNAFDLFPLFGNDPQFIHYSIPIDQNRENIIMDVEILDDSMAELLDRSMFAIVKQRGGDPTEPDDGIQWAEAVLGEVPPPIILQQVYRAVAEEGPGVRATADVIKSGGKERLILKVDLLSTA